MLAGFALDASLMSTASPSGSQTPRILGTGIAAMPAAAAPLGTPHARAVSIVSTAVAV